jgi:hypothetical protein
MSGKAQPFIHKFIADTILDFDQNDYGLRWLRPVQPLYDSQNHRERPPRNYSQGHPRKTDDRLIGRCPLADSRLHVGKTAFAHFRRCRRRVGTGLMPLFLRRKVAKLGSSAGA